MKQLIAFLIFTLSFSKIYCQKQEITEGPVVLKPSKMIDTEFDQAKTYEYVLDMRNLTIIKPQQPYSKVLVFVNNEQAFSQTNYVKNETQLVNHSLRNANAETVLKKAVLKPKIKDEVITLTNPKDNTKIVLKIDRSGNYIKLTDVRTKEIYIAKQQKQEVPVIRAN